MKTRRSSRAFVVSAALSMIGSATARCNMGTNVRECFQRETIAVNGLHMKVIPSIRSSLGSDFYPAGYCMWKSAECYHWHFGRERHVAACSSLSVSFALLCFDLIYSFWLLQIYCCPALPYLRTSSADRSLPVTISFCVGFLIGFTFALDTCSVFTCCGFVYRCICCSQLNVWLSG